MELRNRHYVMHHILGRNRLSDYVRLALWEAFQLVAVATNPSTISSLPKVLAGKFAGLRDILTNRKTS
jgi:hypothetical protein